MITRVLIPLPFALLAACNDSPSVSSTRPDPLAAPAAPLTDWPITRGGPQLQGHIQATVLRNPAVEWTVDLGNPGVAEAAVAEGSIVVGDVTGLIHCIDMERRATRWRFETGDTIQAAPAISQGRVYVGSGDASFLALDLQSGEKIWSIDGGEKFSSAANIVTAPDGSEEWILVNGYDGITRCLRSADGSKVWSYETNDYINGTPALIDGRFVAFGGCDKVIHVIDLNDGSRVNEVPTDAQITNSIATSGTSIYCGNHANQLIATEAEAEHLTWIYDGGNFPFFTAPAVDAEQVYIGSRDKSLHAVNRQTGQAAWKFSTGGRIESSPITFVDGVVFGSSDGRLYAANPADGAELWRLDLGEELTAAPVFAHGRLIIAGGGGTLFVIAATIAEG
jgi:outer membrane protein assembly factor BamB